ncbi:hypothetical protein FACS189494_05630 [Spirochaetia bacterium]|nr:hypothetical protein FACS189494_05630 [Spirochaetia bacterium]
MAKKTCSNGHIYDAGIYGDDCPFCAPQNNIGGKTVISGAVQDSAVQETPKFCSQCGKPLSAGVKFCANCGSAIMGGADDVGGKKTVISPTNDSSNFDDKTQIGTGTKTVISPINDGGGFGGETQIGSGAKTVIYGHAPENEPMARTPEVEAALPPFVAATQVVAPQVVGSHARTIAAVETAREQAAPQKRKGKKAWVIAAGVVVVAGIIAVLFYKSYDPEYYNNRGLAYAWQKNYDKAIADYT